MNKFKYEYATELQLVFVFLTSRGHNSCFSHVKQDLKKRQVNPAGRFFLRIYFAPESGFGLNFLLVLDKQDPLETNEDLHLYKKIYKLWDSFWKSNKLWNFIHVVRMSAAYISNVNISIPTLPRWPARGSQQRWGLYQLWLIEWWPGRIKQKSIYIKLYMCIVFTICYLL